VQRRTRRFQRNGALFVLGYGRVSAFCRQAPFVSLGGILVPSGSVTPKYPISFQICPAEGAPQFEFGPRRAISIEGRCWHSRSTGFCAVLCRNAFASVCNSRSFSTSFEFDCGNYICTTRKRRSGFPCTTSPPKGQKHQHSKCRAAWMKVSVRGPLRGLLTEPTTDDTSSIACGEGVGQGASSVVRYVSSALRYCTTAA
jgi:hypothetical protein